MRHADCTNDAESLRTCRKWVAVPHLRQDLCGCWRFQSCTRFVDCEAVLPVTVKSRGSYPFVRVVETWGWQYSSRLSRLCAFLVKLERERERREDANGAKNKNPPVGDHVVWASVSLVFMVRLVIALFRWCQSGDSSCILLLSIRALLNQASFTLQFES